MLFEIESRKTAAEIEQGLEAAAARHKFGILAVHDLREAMRNKGVEFQGECRIYEVCNPAQAKKVLEANPAISTALPCRISLYRAGEGYRLATLLPTAMLALFQTAGLEEVAREVEATIQAMMREAA